MGRGEPFLRRSQSPLSFQIELRTLKAKQKPEKIERKPMEIHQKPIKNPSKIHQKSMKSMKNR